MLAPVLGWLRRPFDRCRVDGRRIFTKHGYDLCRKHGDRANCEWSGTAPGHTETGPGA